MKPERIFLLPFTLLSFWVSAYNLTAGVTPTPSPTLMLQILGPTAAPALLAVDYAFHINFAAAQSVTCAGGIPCDNTYFPKFVLYFRGDIGEGLNPKPTGWAK
jgi:hypothetical protein